MDLQFSIPCDSEGYLAFGCPFCETEFKLLGSDFQGAGCAFDDLFCPYCGLTDKRDAFYTKEQAIHVSDLCQNYVIEQLNSVFGKVTKDMNKSKYVKVSHTPHKLVEVRELREQDTSEVVLRCNLCEGHGKVFYSVGASKVFCAYCGVDMCE